MYSNRVPVPTISRINSLVTGAPSERLRRARSTSAYRVSSQAPSAVRWTGWRSRNCARAGYGSEQASSERLKEISGERVTTVCPPLSLEHEPQAYHEECDTRSSDRQDPNGPMRRGSLATL